MKLFIIVVSICLMKSTIINGLIGCSCSDLTTKSDCEIYCSWDAKSICNEAPCTKHVNEISCDTDDNCAWTNAGACAQFTKCSDYTVADPRGCYIKNETCFSQGGGLPCLDQQSMVFRTCTTQVGKEQCQGMQTSTEICAWKAGATTPSCQNMSVTSCSGANQFSMNWCNSKSCKWDDTTKICSDLTCADQTHSATCVFIPKLSSPAYTECKWEQDKCVNATTMQHLSAQDCFKFTMATYHWDAEQSKCISCAESRQSQYNQLLQFGITIIVIVILN